MSGGSSDLVLTREARKVFVKNWIDLGRINLRCTNGSLHVRGTLLKLTGTGDHLSESGVNTLFAELKRVKGLKRIYGNFENWQEMSPGVWKQSGQASSDGGPGPTTSGQGGTITFKNL
jgi:hypothetical protein